MNCNCAHQFSIFLLDYRINQILNQYQSNLNNVKLGLRYLIHVLSETNNKNEQLKFFEKEKNSV